jgi:hypothetical protein
MHEIGAPQGAPIFAPFEQAATTSVAGATLETCVATVERPA